MSYRDAQGNPRGFEVDVLTEAARREGLTVNWVPAGNMAANDLALRRGGLDLLAAGTPTAERRAAFYVSTPWWYSELVAVALPDGAVRREQDLNQRRLAVAVNAVRTVAERYPAATLIPRASAVDAAETACSGGADAAIVAGMYLRELLQAATPACRGSGLRVLDIPARIEYCLIARREAAGAARALRTRIDEITIDGTLARIAARHPPVSTPHATRMAELLRIGYERRLWIGLLAFSAIVLALGGAFILWLQLSQRRLSALNQRLAEDLERITRAEAALRESESRFRTLLDAAPQAVLAIDPDGKIAFANPKSAEMFGYAPDELINKDFDMLVPERLRGANSPLRRAGRPGWRPDYGLRSYGTEFPMGTSIGQVRQGGQELILAFMTDISERVALEQQLRQSQKLESIGQLAGGVAHDFNNLLTVISGYAAMAMQAAADGRLREQLATIAQAADRAASLTRQLLTFSRRQTASPKLISPNELIRNLDKMLRRLIGEDIELILSLSPEARSILADHGQIEQVIMNLAVNARDAMPGGGRLLIETSRVSVDEEYAARHLDVPPGRYAQLRVSDTGRGMTPEVKARVFEPFFTTKEPGQGTGLGLSVVYGIVKQSGGAVSVYSEPGRGTTFRILFPEAETGEKPDAQPPPGPTARPGTETILVCEDDPGVRQYIGQVLKSNGYTVMEAGDGLEALDIARRHAGPIQLVLADVVMPEMGGLDLAEQLAEVRPGTLVLHMSGYSDRQHRRRAALAFLEKPFTPSELLSRLREALDDAGEV